MNGLSDVATIERIATIESELAMLRVEAYRRAGIPMPSTIERLSRLVELAAVAFNVTPTALRGNSRAKQFVRARWAVMWVATNVHGFGSSEIGRALGHKDHSTVLYGVHQADALRGTDEDYRQLTDHLFAIVTPKTQAEEATHAPSRH